MSKAALLKSLSDDTKLPQQSVEKVLDALFKQIALTLFQGGRIHVRDFGTFKTSVYKEKTVRNPQTKQLMTIPKRTFPVFRPAPRFKGLFCKDGL